MHKSLSAMNSALNIWAFGSSTSKQFVLIQTDKSGTIRKFVDKDNIKVRLQSIAWEKNLTIDTVRRRLKNKETIETIGFLYRGEMF